MLHAVIEVMSNPGCSETRTQILVFRTRTRPTAQGVLSSKRPIKCPYYRGENAPNPHEHGTTSVPKRLGGTWVRYSSDPHLSTAASMPLFHHVDYMPSYLCRERTTPICTMISPWTVVRESCCGKRGHTLLRRLQTP